MEIKDAVQTYEIPAENLDRLLGHVARLNRRVERMRARGHHVELVQLDVGEGRPKPVPGRQELRLVHDVSLISPKPPQIDGWQLVAALTHVEGVGPLLRRVPGADMAEGELKKYRDASPDDCDHCRVRRRRNDTFVLRNKATGQLCQVGRQCLRDYTGVDDPALLCAGAELLFAATELLGDSEDDDFGGGGCGGGPRFYDSIDQYLPYVACSTRVDGWLSRTDARDRGMLGSSTADLAFSRGLHAPPQERDPYRPEKKDYNLASATIEFCEQYFAERDVESLTDYENSLRVAMASGVAHPKYAGIVASAIRFYQRDLEKREAKEIWSEVVRKSRFQGAIKDRRVFEGLRVMAYRTWETEFGTTHFYSFVDGASNAYVYFASRDMELCIGQVVSLLATVKKHEIREPKKNEGSRQAAQFLPYQQTIITRCSRVDQARVVRQDEVEVPGPLVTTNPEEVARGICAKYARPPVKMNAYHAEGIDGRRYVVLSKAKKKNLGPGAAVVVEYDPESAEAEVPARIVRVVEPSAPPAKVAADPRQTSLFEEAAP